VDLILSGEWISFWPAKASDIDARAQQAQSLFNDLPA
jgi:hypothetical protein